MRNPTELITVIVMLLFAVIVIGLTVKKFYLLRHTLNSNVRKVYFLIFCWWICNTLNKIAYTIKDLYSIILYIAKNNQNDQTETISYLTRIYFAIDWMNAFLIQWLLIFVPYHWYQYINSGWKKLLRSSLITKWASTLQFRLLTTECKRSYILFWGFTGK